MKQLRIFILVLLCVLLPTRGAVAAVMACPEGQVPPASSPVEEHGHHGLHADHGMHADGDVAGSAPGGEHSGTCQFCASGCCVTPLASAPPAVASPLLDNAVVFPTLSAPVPAFESDGPDRPPRTI